MPFDSFNSPVAAPCPVVVEQALPALRQLLAGIVIIDAATQIVCHSDDHAARLLGPAAVTVGQRFDGKVGARLLQTDGSVIVPEKLPILLAARGQVIQDAAYLLERQAGDCIAIRVAAGPIHDEAGRIVAAFASFRDASFDATQSGVAREVGNSGTQPEQRFRALIENSWDGIIVVAIDGRVTYASPSIERILGYRSAELVGEYVFSFIHPDDRSSGEELFREILRSGQGTRIGLFRHRHRDGTYRWIEGTGTNLLDDAAVRGVVSNIRDVTDRLEAERALRQTEARFRAIIDSVTAMVYVKDRDGRYLLVNRHYVEAMNLPREQVLGKRDHDLYPAEMADAYRANDLKVLESGAPMQFEELAPHHDGRHTYISLKVPLRDGSGGVYAVCGVSTDIEQRKHAEEQIRAAREQLQFVTDTMPAFVARCGSDFRFVWVNKGYAERFGMTPEDMAGRSIADVLGAEAFATVRPYMERVLCGEPVEFEVEVPYRSFGKRWMHVVYNPTIDSGGKPDGWIAVISDVSHRKQLEQALRQSEQRYRSLTEAITSIVWTTSVDGRFIEPQPAWEAFTGQAWDQHRDHGWTHAIHPDDRTRVKATWDHAWQTHTVYRSEGRVWHAASGAYRYFEGRAVPVLDADGSVREWFGTYVDVHDRRVAETALRASEDRLRAALTASRTGTFRWDLRTHEMECDENLCRLFGVPSNVGIHSLDRFINLIHPDDREAVADRCQQCADTASDIETDFRVLAQDGSVRWLYNKGQAIRGDDGTPLYMTGACVDISERKSGEQELQRAVSAAEEANRAKDQFLAALSHELRTPLTPVMMAVNALEHDGSISPSIRHDLAMIRRNIELEARLIDDLLDITRVTHGKLRLHVQPVHVHELLRHVVEICRGEAAAKPLELRLGLDASWDRVSGDPARLQQVLWNLLKNAVKFTPRGGRIDVRTSNPSEGQLLIELSDTGTGIAPAALPRLFHAFEQVHHVSRQFGGLGLGLAISKALVELHGGEIWANSEGEGRGAQFYVRLPTSAVSSAHGAPPSSDSSHLPDKRDPDAIRVLLVDDHRDTLRLLARLLQAAGFHVTPVGSVTAALTAAKQERFDVLVSDLGLPDGTGHELMRQMRDLYNVPGIAVSGYGMDVDLRGSEEAGFAAHITKPVCFEDLQQTIRRTVAEFRAARSGT